jgi:transporter family-2 protein
VPWWQWLGGILGAFHVLVNIAFALRLGSGTSVAVFVCVQLSTSIVLDLVGVVGFTKRAFSW